MIAEGGFEHLNIEPGRDHRIQAGFGILDIRIGTGSPADRQIIFFIIISLKPRGRAADRVAIAIGGPSAAFHHIGIIRAIGQIGGKRPGKNRLRRVAIKGISDAIRIS